MGARRSWRSWLSNAIVTFVESDAPWGNAPSGMLRPLTYGEKELIPKNPSSEIPDGVISNVRLRVALFGSSS